jgi:hypothetical protein
MTELKSRLRFEAEMVFKSGEICIDNTDSSFDDVRRFDDLLKRW